MNEPYFVEITQYNSKRKVATTKVKEVLWHGRQSGERQRLGAIAQAKTTQGTEYRVFYIRDNFEVDSRADGSEVFDTSWLMMECFNTLSLAEDYVKHAFADEKALKEELFNVYVKMLQPLG